MEPETSTPKIGPEQGPIEYRPIIEHVDEQSTPEKGLDRNAEHYEQVTENRATSVDASVISTILPPPVITDDQIINQATSIVGPVVAADDDLIEKEWVDKAKKIIADTQNDPYQREELVGQLQRDYVKKRYGRELDEA